MGSETRVMRVSRKGRAVAPGDVFLNGEVEHNSCHSTSFLESMYIFLLLRGGMIKQGFLFNYCLDVIPSLSVFLQVRALQGLSLKAVRDTV